jgi:transposase
MASVSDIQLRSQAVVLAQEGYSHAIIAQKLNRSKRWVTKWVCRRRENQLLVDKPRCGRPKVLSNVAKKLIRNIKYKRGQGLRRLVKQLKARGEAGGKDAIRDYMSKELEWKNWRRQKQPLLTECHKKRRLVFARQHKHWTVEEWSNVMFTDESPFKVFYVPNSRNDTVWGSQDDNVPHAAQMKFSPSVMVWGGMTARGLTSLHFIPQGARMNSEYYIDNILEKLVKPAFNRNSSVGTVTERKLFSEQAKGLFQQDGARCHTSATTIRWLDNNIPSYIHPADWPPNSPDLSPIENIWSILSTSVYRDPEPKTVAQLKRRLRQAWKAVSDEILMNLIKSMPGRMNDVIKKKGNIVR